MIEEPNEVFVIVRADTQQIYGNRVYSRLRDAKSRRTNLNNHTWATKMKFEIRRGTIAFWEPVDLEER